MSSSGISSMILVAASLIIATLVAGLVFELAHIFSDDLMAIGSLLSTQTLVDVSIINNPEYVYDNDNNELTIHLKNTGGETLNLNNPNSQLAMVDLFINGEFAEPDEVEFKESDDTQWRPGEVIRVTWTDVELEANTEHSVNVNVEDNEDNFIFFVEE